MTETENTEHARITALEKAVADLTTTLAAISTGISEGFAARDSRLDNIETKTNELAGQIGKDIGRLESDFAMLGDRPALDVRPLDASETEHVRAVLSRFITDAPPAVISDDD